MTTSRIRGEVDTAPRGPVQRSSFYKENFWFVWSSLRRFGVARADLEDATHDAFVVVYRRRTEMARASSPRGWLFGIVRRVASNHRRGVGRRDRRLAAVRDVGPTATRPERDLERADAARVVGRFLDGLAEAQRDVFVLMELHQMTAREVAELLDINPNTASARLRAARKAFDRFAANVRQENGWDGEAAVTQLRHADPPSRDARKRVGSALGLSLGSMPRSTAAPGLASWAKAVAVTLAVGGGTLGVLTGVASAMRGSSPRKPVTATEPARSSASVPSPTVPAANDPQEPERQAEPKPLSTAEGFHGDAGTDERPAPRSVPTRARTHRESDETAPAETAPVGSSDGLGAQTELLGQARRALTRGRTDEVLRVVAEYRERFGSGPFLAEIELLEIRGYCRRGDAPTARSLAERFERANPGSSHLAVIDETCAGSITKSGSSGH